MVDKELVIKLLSQGIPTSQIAAAAGCDESYVSQLKADPEIAKRVAEKTAVTTIADANFDERLDRAEETVLGRIEKSIGFANLPQALAAFRTLNTARRRKEGPIGPAVTNINVTLTLPANALPRYVTNSNNEIVEVEGRTLVSATPKSLEATMAARINKPLDPALTHGDKAVARLGSLTPLPNRSPRRAPTELSVDML